MRPVLWPFFEPVLLVFFFEFLQENTFYFFLLPLKIKQNIDITIIDYKGILNMNFNFYFFIIQTCHIGITINQAKLLNTIFHIQTQYPRPKENQAPINLSLFYIPFHNVIKFI